MARYVFLMYDAEDWYDTADEQGVADEVRLHEEFMEAAGPRARRCSAARPSNARRRWARPDNRQPLRS